MIFRYDLMAHFSVISDNNHKMSELKFFIGYLAKITILQTRKQTDIHLLAYCNLLICQRNSTQAIHSKISKIEVSRKSGCVCVCAYVYGHTCVYLVVGRKLESFWCIFLLKASVSRLLVSESL